MVAKFRKKRKGKTSDSIFLFFLILLAILVIGYLFYRNFQIYQHRKQLSGKVEHLEQKLLSLEEKRDLLKEGVSEEESQYFIEKEAREKLNLQREGEKAVSFIFPEIEEEEETEEKRSFWSLSGWWEWVKNIF